MKFSVFWGNKSVIVIFATMIIFACGIFTSQQPVATNAPFEEPVQMPPATKPPKQTTVSTSFTNTIDTPFIPPWVADFVNPVLVKVAGQTPDFHDEFTSQLNKGWFYHIPNSDVQPFYAHLSNGTLMLQLPDGKERHDATVYSPKLAHKNFVLSLDFKFGKTEPGDIFRFQFEPAQDQSVIVDLSKSEDFTFRWSLSNKTQTVSGIYDYFSPEFIKFVILIQDDRCAIILNDAPLGYLENCRISPILQPVLQAVSFHLLSGSGHNAEVTMDNVKSWDLDKISSIP